MNAKHKLAQTQRRIKKHAQEIDAYDFFNLLTSTELLSTVEELSPPFRERTFPPTETLSMFLSQALSADRSCQNIVNTSAVQKIVGGLPPHSVRTGSYCKARQRLPTEMIAGLVRCTGRRIDARVPASWRWQGRSVRLIDGTTITLPDTPENQAAYPQPASQKPGLGFPICRVVGIVCLASGSVMNAAMGPYKGKGADEQTLLRGILDTFAAGDIVVGDAYYTTYFLLLELLARGVDAVFEQNGQRRKSTDFRRGKKLGPSDHLIEYTKPPQKPDWMTEEHYREAPDVLTIRELRVDKKILVTTLLSPDRASRHALRQLYKDRWHVELTIRNIKTTMGLETFSCKSPAMAEKELWVYLLAYNLIRLIMAQSALLADILPREISFKHSLRIWHAHRQLSIIDGNDDLRSLCVLIAEITVGGRPGRIEPRAVKRRPKPYPLLMKQREKAREQVKKYGHPKKQK